MNPSSILARSPSPREVEHVSRSAPVSFARDPVVSATGRFVAYLGRREGAPAGSFDIYLTDRATGVTELVSRGARGEPADGPSDRPRISADGRFVAFESHATNLVPDDTNAARDVFVYDRIEGTTTRVSVTSSGEQADDYSGDPALSGDGRWVAFASRAANLGGPGLLLHDRQTGATTAVSGGAAGSPSLSHDGRYLAFEEGLASATSRVARLDRASGEVQAIPSPEPESWCSSPTLSADGSVLAFLAGPPSNGFSVPTSGLYVRDMDRGETRQVRRSPEEPVGGCALSGDGRTVAYQANGLSRQGILRTDLATGETRLVTCRPDGTPDYGESVHPSLDHEGRTLAIATSCRSLSEERVWSGTYEPYRIFAIDTGNVRLAMERAEVWARDEEPRTIEVRERTVDVGGVELPRWGLVVSGRLPGSGGTPA